MRVNERWRARVRPCVRKTALDVINLGTAVIAYALQRFKISRNSIVAQQVKVRMALGNEIFPHTVPASKWKKSRGSERGKRGYYEKWETSRGSERAQQSVIEKQREREGVERDREGEKQEKEDGMKQKKKKQCQRKREKIV